jgi:enoyl-CoA hydratase/carnithine racemase
MADHQYVRYEPVGPGEDSQIVVITLNRPEKLNAISAAVAAEFAEAFHRFADSDAFVAIVAGSGSSFSAGMDVMENFAAGRTTMQAPDIGDDYNVFWPGETSDEDAPSLMKHQHRRLEKLVIAAVHGYTFGGAFLMAMAADLCVAADSTVFEVSEVPRGLVAGWDLGHLHRLTRHVAMELALGLRLTGPRAYELGLVNRLVPEQDVLPTAIDIARQLCHLPRATLVANRSLVDALIPVVPRNVAERAERLRQQIVETPDAVEAFTRFAEKRRDSRRPADGPSSALIDK